MGQPAEKQQRPATYADLEAVPEHLVAEIIAGTLYVSPRPALKHVLAASTLGMILGPPFQLGMGGPGGWWIMDEPELHLDDDVLIPDVAGWRWERMPEFPETASTSLAPDWVCEVLSPSTAPDDRYDKLPVYGREGVGLVWLIDPIKRAVEVHHLGAGGRYVMDAVYRGDEVVRVVPFEAIALPLSALWKRQGGTGSKG
ncbi:Uma2 family endonuclease [Chondromyces apiculatus]|nr:Uma2 family endonuclease [Chondromyces apiculatus]